MLKLTKAGAKLGLELIPPALKQEMTKEVVSTFQEEINAMISKGL